MSDSTDQPKCDACGRFIGAKDIGASRVDFTPLNEFGPEEMEWMCPRCVAAERARRVCRG
jgi:rubredoxin